MSLIPDRLGPKLNLFLLGFVVLLGMATAGLIIFGFERTQDEATRSSREGLEKEGSASLQLFVQTQADFGQAQLETTAGFAQQAARYLVDASDSEAAPPFDASRLATDPRGFLYDPDPNRSTEVLLAADTPLGVDALRDISDSAALDALFPTILQGYASETRSPSFEAVSIYYQSLNNVTRMYPRLPNFDSIAASQATDVDLNANIEQLGPQRNPGRLTIWSAPYEDVSGRGLVITALAPVYAGDNYRGLMGVDVAVSGLVSTIDQLRPTPNGFAFYVDSSGKLFPTTSSRGVQEEIDDPRNVEFASILQLMKEGRTTVQKAEIGGKEMFVAVAPVGGVGGNLALAAPVDEVTQQASQVEAAIDDGGRDTLIFTLLAMGIVCAAGLGAASMLNRRLILQPVAELVAGTRALAAGAAGTTIPVRSTDELGVLAESFNGMTSILHERTQALRASEAELSALFAAMSDVVVVIDRSGRYLRVAPTTPAIWLGAPEVLTGRMLSDVMSTQQADEFMTPVSRALETRESQNYEYTLEVNGEERYFIAVISPMTDDSVVVVARDLTARRRQEEELREREEQYRSTFESTSDGMIITQLEDGRIVDVNPAMSQMHGFSREEFLALHPTQFIHPDDLGLFSEYIEVVGQGGEYRCRARDIRKDGSIFHVEVLGTPVSYNGRRHILGVVRDMTAQVETEEILERSVVDRTRELSALLQVSRSVAAALDIKSVAQSILVELAAVADYDGATLATVEGDDLVIVESWGPFRDQVVGGPTARFPRKALPRDFWHVMERGDPVVIGDVRDETPPAISYREVFGPFLELPSFRDIRSWLAVPLVRQGEIVGLLLATHQGRQHFTVDNTRVIVGAASQAAVAIENARLFEETKNRTRELTTLLDVSTNVASTIELQPLMQLILVQVQAVAEFERASVLILNDDRSALRVMNILRADGSSPTAGAQPDTLFPVDEAPEFWEEFDAGRAVLIDDVRDDSLAAQVYRRAAAPRTDPGLETVRSWMGVPLMANDRVIGIIALTTRKLAAYDIRQSRLLTAIASQAAVAIENARLFAQTEERTRELTTLLDVSTNVASTIELQPLLNLILDQIRVVAPYHRAGFLVLDDGQLEVVAVGARLNEVDELYSRQVGMRFQATNAHLWERVTGGETLIIDDIRGDTREARWYRRAVGEELDSTFQGIRGWMGIPLILRETPIGMLALASDRPGFYTEQHARLARAVADQAAVVIENARLFEQTEQRRKESTALLEISNAVSSSLELQEVVRAILVQLGTVVDYTGSSVIVIQGDELVILASRILDPPNTPDIQGTRLRISTRSEMWRRLNNLEPVIIDDIRGDSPLAREYREALGTAMDSPAFTKIRSWMAVPLANKNRLIGFLSMSRTEASYFTEDHARIASSVAVQAAIAIENARLYEEAEERTQELATLLAVSTNVASTIELQPLLNLILEQVRVVAPYDGATFFVLHDDMLRAEAFVTRPDDEMDLTTLGLEIPTAGSRLWEQAASGQTVIIDDVRGPTADAAAYRQIAGPALDTRFRRVQSWLGVPLMLGERPLGLLALSAHRPGVFTEQHARMARAVTDLAAVAIQNAELYERAQQVASLEERQRLARELHDSVSQALYGIALGARTARTQLDRDPARAVEPVEYVLSLAEAGLAEMRALIFELRPESLQTEGLVAAIEKQIASTRARYGLEVTADLCAEPDVRIEVKEALYRVAQEALHNIVKHAQAEHVMVQLRTSSEEVSLAVKDDGRGFDPKGSYPGHVGLHSMRERVEKLRGSISIESEQSKGSQITVRVPF